MPPSSHSSLPTWLTTALLTFAALLAFAGNSVLARWALESASIDAVSFSLIRIMSGAGALALIVSLRRPRDWRAGSWRGALMLSVYMVFFSLAYLALNAGVGALILFGVVQLTMIVAGLAKGERLSALQTLSFGAAASGLVYLLAPVGDSAPPNLLSAIMMTIAGLGWGFYSLNGRTSTADPTAATLGNFWRAVPICALGLLWPGLTIGASGTGVLLAIISGALTSGLGYALWYGALRDLRATTAANVQLSVPVITALMGAAFLGETISPRLMLASVIVLGGISLYLYAAQRKG